MYILVFLYLLLKYAQLYQLVVFGAYLAPGISLGKRLILALKNPQLSCGSATELRGLIQKNNIYIIQNQWIVLFLLF